jgi:hypothetical protein
MHKEHLLFAEAFAQLLDDIPKKKAACAMANAELADSMRLDR